MRREGNACENRSISLQSQRQLRPRVRYLQETVPSAPSPFLCFTKWETGKDVTHGVLCWSCSLSPTSFSWFSDSAKPQGRSGHPTVIYLRLSVAIIGFSSPVFIPFRLLLSPTSLLASNPGSFLIGHSCIVSQWDSTCYSALTTSSLGIRYHTLIVSLGGQIFLGDWMLNYPESLSAASENSNAQPPRPGESSRATTTSRSVHTAGGLPHLHASELRFCLVILPGMPMIALLPRGLLSLMPRQSHRGPRPMAVAVRRCS